MEMKPKIAFKDCSKQGKIKYIQEYIKKHPEKTIAKIAKHFKVSTSLVSDYASEEIIEKRKDKIEKAKIQKKEDLESALRNFLTTHKGVNRQSLAKHLGISEYKVDHLLKHLGICQLPRMWHVENKLLKEYSEGTYSCQQLADALKISKSTAYSLKKKFNLPFEKRITLTRKIKGKNSLEIKVAIHPHKNGIIVVNYPGLNEDLDGPDNRYIKQANQIQKRSIGTFVRIGNSRIYRLPYPQSMIDNLKYLLDYCLSNGKQLSGNSNPKLYLKGFSAGASTIATILPNYSQIEKILLIAPSEDAGIQEMRTGLKQFKGEVYITVGDKDKTVGPNAGSFLYSSASSAKIRKLVTIKNCDHNFTGETNSKIFDKATFWAFAGDDTYPSLKE